MSFRLVLRDALTEERKPTCGCPPFWTYGVHTDQPPGHWVRLAQWCRHEVITRSTRAALRFLLKPIRPSDKGFPCRIVPQKLKERRQHEGEQT